MYSETYGLGAVDGGVVGFINAEDLSNQHASYVRLRLAMPSCLRFGVGRWVVGWLFVVGRLHINAKLRVGNPVQDAVRYCIRRLLSASWCTEQKQLVSYTMIKDTRSVVRQGRELNLAAPRTRTKPGCAKDEK